MPVRKVHYKSDNYAPENVVYKYLWCRLNLGSVTWLAELCDAKKYTLLHVECEDVDFPESARHVAFVNRFEIYGAVRLSDTWQLPEGEI